LELGIAAFGVGVAVDGAVVAGGGGVVPGVVAGAAVIVAEPVGALATGPAVVAVSAIIKAAHPMEWVIFIGVPFTPIASAIEQTPHEIARSGNFR
jgi:hypothetical protein